MKKRDWILIAVLAAAALPLLFFGLKSRFVPVPEPSPAVGTDAGYTDFVRLAVAEFFEANPAESYLVVETRNGLHAPIPLNEENEFRLTQADGSENVVHIGRNSFYMASSNCDNQSCVKQGEVTLENRDARLLLNMVICLPHELSLELLTREEAEALLTELYTQAKAAELPAGEDGHAG